MICVNRDVEHMAEDHLALVETEARFLMSRPMVRALGWDEAIGVGNLALVEAAQTYDFRHTCSFKTYAARAVKRSILRAARKEMAHDLPSLEREPTNDRYVEVKDMDLRQRMRRLSAREHAAVHLRGLQGLPWNEIASRMGISPQNAARLYRVAIRKMRPISLDRDK